MRRRCSHPLEDETSICCSTRSCTVEGILADEEELGNRDLRCEEDTDMDCEKGRTDASTDVDMLGTKSEEEGVDTRVEGGREDRDLDEVAARYVAIPSAQPHATSRPESGRDQRTRSEEERVLVVRRGDGRAQERIWRERLAAE